MKTKAIPRLTVIFLGLIAPLGVSSGAHGENWPQWRGSNGDGVSTERGVLVEWGEDRNVLWKVAVDGRGHSSPIVWGNHVFLTSAVEGEIVPGAKAVVHIENAEVYVHPDSVGADRKHAFKVPSFESDTGRLL